jgi:hypothetical protein
VQFNCINYFIDYILENNNKNCLRPSYVKAAKYDDRALSNSTVCALYFAGCPHFSYHAESV